MRKEVLSVCPLTLYQQIKRCVVPMEYRDAATGKIKQYKTVWNRGGRHPLAFCVMWAEKGDSTEEGADTFDLVIHKSNKDLCDFSFKTNRNGGGRYDGVIFRNDSAAVKRNKIYYVVLQFMQEYGVRAMNVDAECLRHITESIPAGLPPARVKGYLEYIKGIKVGKMCVTCHKVMKNTGQGNKRYCSVKCRRKAGDMRNSGQYCLEWGGHLHDDWHRP